MRFSRYVCVVLCCTLVAAFGCSGAPEKPKVALVPAAGTVNINGQPGTGVAINFIPAPETPGLGGYAVADETGRFQVKYNDHSSGILAGTYHLTFSKMAQPDGSPIPPGKDAADVGAVEQLPTLAMVNPSKPYVVSIDQPVDSLSFDLKTKGK
ncbi:hypothetical protein [Planctomicrobium piriforme]|uniref:Carboxypeptidase regulatory-like domain-containing protein n=1 Tax=Planctomicrobium piriforme TaxID=1576369 RepID=A0A1I3PTS3_9PLAN|nr:hypothetical protein [Planctomicrobium piriforme]SFJ24346.1 hypothetical protein SAMN05421753_11717 [Planctomicrobium piriforme]